MLDQAEVIETDVLVLGGGIAGCLAAIEARKNGVDVVLVDKGNAGRSGSSPLMSGIMTVFDPEEDDFDAWLKHCVEVGQYLNEQDIVAQVIEGSALVMRDLQDWGVEFLKKDGKLQRYQSIAGAMNAKMVNGGIQLMDVVRGEVVRRRVRLVERVVTAELLTSDGEHPTQGRVVGALGFHMRTGKPYLFKARATIVATGAVAFRRESCKSPFVLGSDGIMAAYRAGCRLKNLELTLAGFAPTGFNIAPAAHLVLGQGAYLLNARGERFMERYEPSFMEHAPRCAIGVAIAREYDEGRGPVFFDARHLTNEAHTTIKNGIPVYVRTLEKAGLSLKKDLIKYKSSTAPCMGPGGIRIDGKRASSVPGLYAAGSSADHAEDGADNAIGNGMESAVAGRTAGQSAAEYARECPEPAIRDEQAGMLAERLFEPLGRGRGVAVNEVWENTGAIWDSVEVLRSAGSLGQAIEGLQQIESEKLASLVAEDHHALARALGVANRVSFLGLLCRSALLRTESRGGHFRRDFPAQDDKNWLKWVVCRRGSQGVEVWDEPVPFARYPIKPPV